MTDTAPAEPQRCEHYACRCARAAELAELGRTLDAIAVHSQWVLCRQPEHREPTARELLER